MTTEWSKEPLSIYDFIKGFEYPQLVKIYDGDNKKLQVPGNFDLRQPILLYKVYTGRKIHARALSMDDRGRIKPSGPGLIIPDNYPGWLSLVMRDGRTAGYFESVGEISRASLPMFLVQDSVVGLKADSSGLQRTVIPHGEVLKVISTYEDSNRQEISIQLKGNIHPDVMMYLKCISRKGVIVYLPYSTKGRFYCISSPQSHTLNHVYLISNLLRVTKLPTLVRIVSGPKPHVALPFTNVVQLEKVHRETILLGCTLVNNEPTLLEINADSKLSFITVRDESHLLKTNTYKRMRQLCTMDGERWRQQIRVAHHVIPVKSIEEYKSSTPSSLTCVSQPKRRDFKPALPACDMIEYLRYSYCDRVFSRRFWMFRRNRRIEFPNVYDRSPFEILRAYYAKCKSRKGRNGKDSLHIRRFEKFRIEYPRLSSSDDGYSTSCADEESIYNSIH